MRAIVKEMKAERKRTMRALALLDKTLAKFGVAAGRRRKVKRVAKAARRTKKASMAARAVEAEAEATSKPTRTARTSKRKATVAGNGVDAVTQKKRAEAKRLRGEAAAAAEAAE